MRQEVLFAELLLPFEARVLKVHSSPTQDKTGFHAVAPLSGLLSLLPESQTQILYWMCVGCEGVRRRNREVLLHRSEAGAKPSLCHPPASSAVSLQVPQAPPRYPARVHQGPRPSSSVSVETADEMTGWAPRPYPTPRTWFSGTWEREDFPSQSAQTDTDGRGLLQMDHRD